MVALLGASSVRRGPSPADRVKRQRRARPVGGRTANASLASGTTFATPSTLFTLDAAAVFKTTLVFSIGADGIIFNAGNATTGALVAVIDDVLVVRAGGGGALPETTAARATYSLDLITKNRRVDLAWAFEPDDTNPIEVKVWLDGDLVASDIADAASSSWAADAAGGFDALNGTLPIEAVPPTAAYSDSTAFIDRLFQYEFVPSARF